MCKHILKRSVPIMTQGGVHGCFLGENTRIGHSSKKELHSLIPEKLFFFGKAKKAKKVNINCRIA